MCFMGNFVSKMTRKKPRGGKVSGYILLRKTTAIVARAFIVIKKIF